MYGIYTKNSSQNHKTPKNAQKFLRTTLILLFKIYKKNNHYFIKKIDIFTLKNYNIVTLTTTKLLCR